MKMCFIGGARYSQPLNDTSEKKWRLMSGLGEMFVIGFSQDLRPRRFTQYARFYLLPKFPWPVLRYLAMFTVGPILTLWLILRHDMRVLVAQSPYEGFAAAVAKVLAHIFGRRTALIVESHGDFEVSLFLQRRVHCPSLYRWLMRRTAQFALQHADLLRAVSSSTRRQLEVWVPGKPLVQFPAWTDIDAFLEAGCQDGPRELVILYAGVLIPRKGVHHLVRAFAKVAPEFPEARLEIVGREENRDYVEELRREVNGLGLNGRVSFMGEVPQMELARRMRRACVFVLPSLSEGLGRVVVEAIATGTPVIGSRVGGIPEMVQDGLTGFLVSPGDEQALAERLRWVLEHPQEAKAMGYRAREFARSFFSPEAYLAGYRGLLEMAEEAAKISRREASVKTYKHESYDAYKAAQIRKYFKKHNAIFAADEELEAIAMTIKRHVPFARFGICHGVRTGYEVWKLSRLLPGVEVIGTDIAPVEGTFGNVQVVQWDFHDANPKWEGRADFIYSNSWDHSYDFRKCLRTWLETLSPQGLLFLSWTPYHAGHVDEADCLSLTFDELRAIVEEQAQVLSTVSVTQWRVPGRTWFYNAARILLRRKPVKSFTILVAKRLRRESC